LVTGLVLENKISAKRDDLTTQTVTTIKSGSGALITNYAQQFNGLASSVLIDNQDGSNAVTVRINRGINSITIPASNFRAFNDSFIEQIDLTGASTDTQLSAQVVSLKDLGLR